MLFIILKTKKDFILILNSCVDFLFVEFFTIEFCSTLKKNYAANDIIFTISSIKKNNCGDIGTVFDVKHLIKRTFI